MAENQNSSAEIHNCLDAEWRGSSAVPVGWGFGSARVVWGGLEGIKDRGSMVSPSLQRPSAVSKSSISSPGHGAFTERVGDLHSALLPLENDRVMNRECKGYICRGLENNFSSRSLCHLKSPFSSLGPGASHISVPLGWVGSSPRSVLLPSLQRTDDMCMTTQWEGGRGNGHQPCVPNGQQRRAKEIF